uniref:Uncharacterized protein n=1 Tax=Triticum urartu TaxID=4572 RepID=A0A8R7V5H6_TRIUA
MVERHVEGLQRSTVGDARRDAAGEGVPGEVHLGDRRQRREHRWDLPTQVVVLQPQAHQPLAAANVTGDRAAQLIPGQLQPVQVCAPGGAKRRDFAVQSALARRQDLKLRCPPRIARKRTADRVAGDVEVLEARGNDQISRNAAGELVGAQVHVRQVLHCAEAGRNRAGEPVGLEPNTPQRRAVGEARRDGGVKSVGEEYEAEETVTGAESRRDRAGEGVGRHVQANEPPARTERLRQPPDE